MIKVSCENFSHTKHSTQKKKVYLAKTFHIPLIPIQVSINQAFYFLFHFITIILFKHTIRFPNKTLDILCTHMLGKE